MRRLLLIGGFLMLGLAGGTASSVDALGLKVAPLDYNVALKKGEKQKGFIDLSNPTGATVRVKSSVQAFRQTNDTGTLSFYDDEQVSAGIGLDLDEFELGPREAIRMYFLVDGTKLPEGDVFAAIFFTTQPLKQGAGVTQLIRLGTIVSIVNGTPGERRAEITKLDVPFVQFGDNIKGSYIVKNTGDASKSTGFYPSVVLAVDPLHKEMVQRARLVFAGRSRENSFEIATARLGFYKVSVSYANSTKEQWVFAINGLGLVVLGLLFVLGIVGIFVRKMLRTKAVENLRINR